MNVPKPIALAALLFSFAISASAQSIDDPNEAARSFRNYLNYHRGRIDAKFHPDPKVRASGTARVNHLKLKIEKLDLEAVCKSINTSGGQRRQVSLLLDSMTKSATADLFNSEAQLRALEKFRDDPNTAAEEKPAAEQLESVEKKIAWSRARSSFLEKSSIALRGKPTIEQRASELYDSLVELEEIRLKAKILSAAEKKRKYKAAYEILSKRLHGHTIESARNTLRGRQLTSAASALSNKLKPISPRRSALAGRYPEEDQLLRELKKFYETELTELSTLRKKHPVPRRKPGEK